MNTVFSWSKVIKIHRYWMDRLQTMKLNYEPKQPMCNGVVIPEEHIEHYQAMNAVDKFSMFVKVYYTAGHTDTFKGERAKGIWNEWCRRQFSKE